MGENRQVKQLAMLFLVLCLSFVLEMNAQAKTVKVSSWVDLQNKINEQTANDGVVEYQLGNNLLADSTIKISEGKKVTIVNETGNLIKRRLGFADNLFYVVGEKTELRVKGKADNSRLYIDGSDTQVAGRFVVVAESATFYLDQYATVRSFHCTGDGAAIHNSANTTIYHGSQIVNCTSDTNGNAILNAGTLKIAGCNISGAKNDKPDIYQGGVLSFETDANNLLNYVFVKIEKGMNIAASEKTSVNSDFKLVDNKYPIRIDSGVAINVPIITVKDKINGTGGASLRQFFKAGAGFENRELLELKNVFYKTEPLTEAAITTDEVIIVGMDEEDITTLAGRYANPSALVQNTSWTASAAGYLNINKTSDTTCELNGKKHTGPANPVTLTYTVSNANHKVNGDIKVIVEQVPEITFKDENMQVGEKLNLKAPAYDGYKVKSYQWMQSKDGGTTWAKVAEGTGGTTSGYTTVELVPEAENWRFKCVITLKADAEKSTIVKTLTSQEVSLASLNKERPTLSLRDKKAVYTGGRITIDNANVDPRDLLGYVKYEYYTDVYCKQKTTTKNGASTVGGAPSNVGVYYVKAYLNETERYKGVNAEMAILEISKAKGEIAVKDELVKMEAGSSVTIGFTKNLGNSSFKLELSNSKVLKAEAKNGKIVCTPIKPGNCTVVVNTTGNGNVFPTTTSFNVEIRPAKVKLKALKAKKKKMISMQIGLLDYASGYDVQISAKPNFKKCLKNVSFSKSELKDLKKNKGKISYNKKIKSKKKYYVRVRAYTKVKGKKRVGAWSEKIKVKAK